MKTNPNFEQNLANLSILTEEQKSKLDHIEKEAIANFSGLLEELESALGLLRMGHHFGWRVLVLIHNKRTIKKYEEILGIRVRDFFPDEGPSAARSHGYRFANNVGNFWKAVSGDIKVENRRQLE